MTDLLTRITQQARADAQPVTKSLADLHPELTDRVHVMTVQHNAVMTMPGMSYAQASADYDFNVWVRKAIRVVADNFAALPLTIMRGKDRIDIHDVLKLLKDVNDKMSSFDLHSQWVIDMMLGGEEGWELVKNARGNVYLEIWPRPQPVIYIVPDASKVRYYGVAEYSINDNVAKPYSLLPDEFVHFKFFNPRNPWRGISNISAVRNSIVIDQMAQAWSKLFFFKSARPDYAVVAPQGITRPEREDLEKMLESKFGGTANAHKPIVLEQGVTDIKPIDFRPKDIEWLTQREVSRDEIAAIFGVPDILMGFGNDSYDTPEKRVSALQVLYSIVIIPLTTYRDMHLTEFFRRAGALRPDESIVTDYSGVGALREDENVEWGRAKDKIDRGVMTINQYRTAKGDTPVPWGDVWWAQSSLVPVSGPDAPMAPAAPDDSSDGAAADEAKAASRRTKKIAGPEYGSDEHKQLFDAFIKRAEKHEKKLGKVVAGLLERQRDEVIARLHAGGKAAKSASDVADNPFDKDEWTDEFRKEVKPVIKGAVKDAGQAAMEDLSAGISFDVLDPNVVRFIKQREQRFSQRVNDTTWQQLSDSLAAGVEDGESIPALVERVEHIMGNRIRSSAETIARTEIIGDYNGGTLESWKQSEVVEGKTWLAALDDRTRDSHREAHGQTVDIDDDFEVGDGSGPAPGQIGEAEEDVNCRCSMKAKVNQRALARRFSGNGHKKAVLA